MTIRFPLILLVLAATAIPVELQPLPARGPDISFHFFDIAANIAGYVPVGIVLGGLGALRAVGSATLMSGLVETGQLFMEYRFPSPIDIASNVIGAALGVLISVPMSFLSGAFFLIPGVNFFTWNGHDIGLYDVLPSKHAVDAMRQVMTFGASADAVAFSIVAMLLLALLYFAVGVMLFRKLRLAPE